MNPIIICILLLITAGSFFVLGFATGHALGAEKEKRRRQRKAPVVFVGQDNAPSVLKSGRDPRGSFTLRKGAAELTNKKPIDKGLEYESLVIEEDFGFDESIFMSKPLNKNITKIIGTKEDFL